MNGTQDTANGIQYAIRIKGHLSDSWLAHLDEVTIECTDDGNTIITCKIIDQSMLYGLFKRMRDFGIELISINRIETN